jgi:phage terminase large subunit-like protein
MQDVFNHAKRAATGETPDTFTDRYVDPISFITTEFYIPELRGPITLMPYQIAVLREAYRRDEAGLFVYSTILWGDIKKSAKSSIAAAVCLERASHTPYASVKVIANDLKQADSRVAYYMRRAIDLNPRLRNRIKQRRTKTFLPNKSTIEAIPIDPSGEAGGNDDLICFSELWGAKGEQPKRMWTEMTLSPTKYGQSQRWIETYAGFSGESELLEQLYDSGVTNGRLIDIGIPALEIYVNEAARLLCMWNTIPRCPWQTPAYYAQEAAALTTEEFNRVHRNQWSSATMPFVALEWWTSCRRDNLPEIERHRELVVALDAGVSDDCFGLVAVSRETTWKREIDPVTQRPGPNKKISDMIVVRHVKKWTPPKGGKMQYSNVEDPTDRNFPEGEIRWLAENYNVVCFTYDPYQLHHLCTELRNEGIGLFQEFSQGAMRLEADKQLYDLIRDRRIVHDGNADLVEHVKNANRKEDGDSKLRIIKRSEKLKIDLCVSLSMASYKGLQLLPE